MKHITTLFIGFLISINIHAQTEPLFPEMMGAKTIDFPTPNAASLGKYGQIPVSYYNGLVNISIPIYTIKLQDIEVPIVLQYHSGGNKTDEHPGWVGLGWNLQAGGSITRIVKGKKDEALQRDIILYYKDLYQSSQYGFFYKNSLLNIDNWTAESSLVTILNDAAHFHYDTEPDEFIFNFSGIGGSFFFTNDPQTGATVTKVQSKQPIDLKIEYELYQSDIQSFTTFNNDSLVEGSTVDVTKPFIQFTITTSNGIKYIFGATGYGSYNDPTQASIAYTSALAGSGYTTTPTTWNLTSIESPHGEYIHFFYDRSTDALINQKCGYRYKVINDPNAHYPDPEYDDNFMVIHPSYLKKIITSNHDTIDFSTSTSNELTYQYSNKDRDNLKIFASKYGNTILDDIGLIEKSAFLKLDNIIVKNKMNVKFNYIENESERLKLESLETSFPQTKETKYRYQFQYNQTKLPPYNAKKSDKWGYFNNTYYGNGYMANIDDSTAIERIRQPNPEVMDAEILTRIYYPTGGYTTFEYEPHVYSQVMKKFPIFNYIIEDRDTIYDFQACGLRAQIGICGGLRIKKITDTPNTDSDGNDIIRTFSYELEDGTSSGILSIEPTFWARGLTKNIYEFKEIGKGWFNQKTHERGRLEILQISENLLNPLNNSSGAPVTYSRVIEHFSNGSKSIYTYTNHENFMDEPAIARIENILGLTLDEPYTSDELERGLLKSVTHYTSTGNIDSKIEYQYNNDKTRYDNYIKSIVQKVLPSPRGLNFWRLSTQKIYTFCPYVIKEIKSKGDGSSNNNLMDIETSYKYDDKNRVIETSMINSNGDIHKTTYEYPDDIQGDYSQLIEHHIYPVIRTTKYVNDNVIQIIQHEYDGINLSKTYIGKNANNMEPRIIYSHYTPLGNPTYIEKDGKPEAIYIWGYNYQYPIAEIKNVTYERFSHIISSQTLEQIGSRNIPSVSQWQVINNLRDDLPEALITTYSYKPGIGIISKIDPRGIKTSYIYDPFGRLTDIKDHEGNLLEHYDYQYATESQN